MYQKTEHLSTDDCSILEEARQEHLSVIVGKKLSGGTFVDRQMFHFSGLPSPKAGQGAPLGVAPCPVLQS